MPGYSNYSKTAFTKQVTGKLDMKEKDIIRVGNIYFDNDTALLGLSNGILTLSGDLDMSDNSIENVKYIRFETLKEDYYTDLLNHDPSYIYLHTVRDQYTTALAISTSDIGIY